MECSVEGCVSVPVVQELATLTITTKAGLLPIFANVRLIIESARDSDIGS